MGKYYCVLIDSENATPKMEEIFNELSKYGDTPIRYLFGDFSTNNKSKWKDLCKKFSITPMQTFNFTTGKNSVDISLVISGMELLYTKSYLDGIVIVSSDSDYTSLARKWRNEGKEVIGIGKKLTPESLRSSCTSFIYIENLLTDKEVMGTKSDITTKVSDTLKELVKNILNEYNGRVQISVIVDAIRKVNSDFDVRTYGYKKAPEFFRKEFNFLTISESKENIYVAQLNNVNSDKSIMDKKVIDIINKCRGKKINMGELNKRLVAQKIDFEQFGYSRIKKYLETIPQLVIKDTDVYIKK